MKILVGASENCGILYGISEGFKALGHTVKTFVKQRDRYFSDIVYDYDFSGNQTGSKFLSKIPGLRSLDVRLRESKRQKRIRNTFANELLDFDLYVFTWDTILPDLEDLAILKKLNKKLVFVFIGSEARYAPAFKKQFPDSHLPWPEYYLNESLDKKLKFLRTIELMSDSIHSLPDMDGLFIRPYHPTYVPYIIKNFYKSRENDIPVIVHAPSNRDLKGTRHILSVIELLKKDGLQFEFKVLEKLPNHAVLEELQKADIAIDQIYLHYPGIFATESMAMGCAVVTRAFTDEKNAFFHPPVFPVTEHNLYEKLKSLIIEKDYRVSIAAKGYDFVKQTNTPAAIAQKILDGLSPQQKPHFNPRFFIDQFEKDDKNMITDETKSLNRDVIKKYITAEKVDSDIIKLQGRGLA